MRGYLKAAPSLSSASLTSTVMIVLPVRRYYYNHLYWTRGIPTQSLEDFVGNRAHWRVIEHENFNPRWIADTLNRIAPPPPLDEGEDPGWI